MFARPRERVPCRDATAVPQRAAGKCRRGAAGVAAGQARGEPGEDDATLAFSTTIQPSYKHHTTSIEPTKDKPLCSNKVAGEEDATSAQKLGRRQPFVAVFPQECMGNLAYFWASLTPFSPQERLLQSQAQMQEQLAAILRRLPPVASPVDGADGRMLRKASDASLPALPATADPSETDAKLARKLGQLQPFMAVFPTGMHGPAGIF
jgi:hypothetical protein